MMAEEHPGYARAIEILMELREQHPHEPIEKLTERIC
jgi:hypothetical protein